MDKNQQEQFRQINDRIDDLNKRINESDEALSQAIANKSNATPRS